MIQVVVQFALSRREIDHLLTQISDIGGKRGDINKREYERKDEHRGNDRSEDRCDGERRRFFDFRVVFLAAEKKAVYEI